MGLLKLAIALIVIICIVVIIREVFTRRSKEKMVEDLADELDKINDGDVRTDLEIDVVDAKTALKEKRATLAEKAEDLIAPASTRTQEPLQDVAPEKKAVPKKKVAKKKAAPKKKVAKKKAAPKKKVAKKKAAPKKKASPKTSKK